MDIIALAREIGHQIQADARYTALRTAQADSDADGDLQELIGECNLKRLAINNEASADAPDADKQARLNRELREVYAKIMSNEHMKAYEQAKGEMDQLVQRIQSIILQSVDGADPDTADLVESCGGNCAHCAGCH